MPERPLLRESLRRGTVPGLVLLSSFLVMGFGLGSSGAVTRFAVAGAHLVAPKAVETNAIFSQYYGPGKHVLEDWLVFEVLGVFLGGVLGAYSAGRLKLGIERVRARRQRAASSSPCSAASRWASRRASHAAARRDRRSRAAPRFPRLLGFMMAVFTAATSSPLS